MNADEKARRLLTEGRLIVEKVHDGLIVASCRGDSGEVYALGWDGRGKGEWRCQCESSAKFHRTCSHLLALKLVVVRPKSTPNEGSTDG